MGSRRAWRPLPISLTCPKSYLDCQETHAVFKGTLDIKTLGGAGFASQRTTREDRVWDLSGFDGIELTLNVKHSDEKRYTFILKDELLPPEHDIGCDQSTISWEYGFVVCAQETPVSHHSTIIFIPWDSFTATYRGKEREDAKELDLTSIKRFSIMMRRYTFLCTGKSRSFWLTDVQLLWHSRGRFPTDARVHYCSEESDYVSCNFNQFESIVKCTFCG